jgi:2-C-methyl-D-erythritol 4-phosphate cytidylyltransferase
VTQGASRLPKSDASPPVSDGYARGADTGSAHGSAMCATEDTASRRSARSEGRGFAFQQPPRQTLALVVAGAGHGTRLDMGGPKQYVPLLGIPMLQRTLDVLGGCPAVDALVVVVNEPDVEYCRTEIIKERIPKVLAVVAGGEERALSVRSGLAALAQAGSWDLVGTHDGARPLITCEDVSHTVEALAAGSGLAGAVLGVPSTDTIKLVDAQTEVISTPDRRLVWRAQTPQIFRWDALYEAYAETPENELVRSTDDASLVENRGGRVVMVKGSPENFKVTDRVDLRHAEQILAERRRD